MVRWQLAQAARRNSYRTSHRAYSHGHMPNKFLAQAQPLGMGWRQVQVLHLPRE
ncbi:hypothetical protein ACFLZW_03365 [Chloroflexota bacterium]